MAGGGRRWRADGISSEGGRARDGGRAGDSARASGRAGDGGAGGEGGGRAAARGGFQINEAACKSYVYCSRLCTR